MLLKIHPDNPNARQMEQAVKILQGNGVIIFPTDTIYAIGCRLRNNQGIERICQLIGKKPEKANLSLICNDLSHLSDYTLPISNPVFKLLKAVLPGPYTFIFNANNSVPKIFKNNKRTIGIRVPNNAIAQQLVQMLGEPMVSASIHSEDDIREYLTDPEEIHDLYENRVDAVIDGEAGGNEHSTVIDCTEMIPTILREGKGMESLPI